MTSNSDAFFDPAPYSTRPDRAPRAKPAGRQPNAVYDPTWFLLGRVIGQSLSEMHRYRAADHERGGVITVCGRIGRRIDVSDMVRPGSPIYACPDCLSGRKRKDGER